MPYVLLYERRFQGIGNATLYLVDKSVKLVSTGNTGNVTLRGEPFNVTYNSGNLWNRRCLRPVIEGNYVRYSHFRVPLESIRRVFGCSDCANRSCAVAVGEGILIIPPSMGVAFANHSMWVERGRNFHRGDFEFFLEPNAGSPAVPLNLSLAYFDGRTLRELPLLEISGGGTRVLAPQASYGRMEGQSRFFEAIVLLLVALTLSIGLLLKIRFQRSR